MAETKQDLDMAEASPIAPSGIDRLIFRPTAFGNETGDLPNGEFEPGQETKTRLLENTKVLVIGAGGLGCEILKDLALSGFRDIEVIDLDTIDVSNLNRQFLFRKTDVGRFKSEVAAEFIMKRVRGVRVTPHVGYIQKKKPEFYQSFNLIIAGLDNVDARRWMNSLLASFVTKDEEGEISEDAIIIPLIDGGTEGFKGQARVILPRITACFECTLGTLPPPTGFPLCTIAETPRKPEHCIAYAFIIEWDKQKPFEGAALDKDSPEHMAWVHEVAAARARKFSIAGVTYMLTMGVVKNIIPAIASTNALISAACVAEALKLTTFASRTLNNNTMFMGGAGMNVHSMEYAVGEDCPVCNSITAEYTLSPRLTLARLVEGVLKPDTRFNLTKPSVTALDSDGNNRSLLMMSPASLFNATKGNLQRTLQELQITDGDELSITDPVLVGTGLTVLISLDPTSTLGFAVGEEGEGEAAATADVGTGEEAEVKKQEG